MFLLFPLHSISSIFHRMEFTFQYVSIISRKHKQIQEVIKIYIPICFYYFVPKMSEFDKGYLHLHSNMFLLFQEEGTEQSVLFTIYIPICFYYFPSNVALYNSTTILPSFVDPVIIFCFFKKIFSFFPKPCIFPAKRQLSTPHLFYLITGRQFSFYMSSPSVSNSSCIISPMPFPVSNSNSYLYVALWISITFRFLPLPIIFLSTFSGNF